MNSIDEKKKKALMHRLGLKYKLSDEVIKQIVESPYEFSAEVIKNLDLTHVENEEDLKKERTNFMYGGFAKLYIKPLNYKKLLKWKK